MYRLRNIAVRDYQESVTTGQTRHMDRGTDRQKPDKVIPMCRYPSLATQKVMRDYQESVTTGQTHGQRDRQTDAG